MHSHSLLLLLERKCKPKISCLCDSDSAERMEVSYRQGETIVETLSSGGGSGVGKWECGAVEPREAEEFTAAGAGAVPQGV
jgi:hypothetical protein